MMKSSTSVSRSRPGSEPGACCARARLTVAGWIIAALAALTALSAPVPMAAQELGRVVSPILTLDRERLFSGTLFGQRVTRELEAASSAMAEKTREIEAGLSKEEKALADKRASLSPEEFRKLADAFDAKVQTLRADRDKAKADLQTQIDTARKQFFDQVGPVLAALVRSRGAVVVLDSRAILLTAADVDITDAAIARVDAVLGEGEVVAPGDTPSVTPGTDTLAPDVPPSDTPTPGGPNPPPAGQ